MFKTCPLLTILICKASGYLYIYIYLSSFAWKGDIIPEYPNKLYHVNISQRGNDHEPLNFWDLQPDGSHPFPALRPWFFHRGIITLVFFSRQRVTLPNACLKMESMEYPPNCFLSFFDRSNDDEPMDLGVYCPISRPRSLDRTGNSNQNSGWDERSSSSGAVKSLVKQVDWDQPLVVSHASLGSKVLSPPTNYSGLPTRSIIPWFMIICLTNWNGNSAVYPMSGQTHHQKSPRDSFALITLQLLGPELVGLLWYRLTLWLVS